jgi:hypothetical protein
MTKTKESYLGPFWTFGHLNFELVSSFEIRIFDFDDRPSRIAEQNELGRSDEEA